MRAIQQLYKEFSDQGEVTSGSFHVFTTGGEEKVTLPDSE
jgi:hypothetical protein